MLQLAVSSFMQKTWGVKLSVPGVRIAAYSRVLVGWEVPYSNCSIIGPQNPIPILKAPISAAYFRVLIVGGPG